jgi:lipopolysaccharide biosynthesis protein
MQYYKYIINISRIFKNSQINNLKMPRVAHINVDAPNSVKWTNYSKQVAKLLNWATVCSIKHKKMKVVGRRME